MRFGRARLVAGSEPARHLGQEHDADRDADDADRQLIDAVGVIERRERAGRQKRRDDRVGEQRELHPARADDRRPQRLEETPGRLVELGHLQTQAETVLLGVDTDEKRLQNAGGKHAPGRRVTRGREQSGESERADHANVEENRRRGRRGKALVGVERARDEGFERDQCQIGKGDARERHREIEAHRIVGESGRQYPHDRWRKSERNREQHELHDHHPRGNPVGEAPRHVGAIPLQRAGIGGHERGAERALGENRAEMIGQPECDKKSVGDRPGAEDRRHNDVADETGDAGSEREPADGEDAPDHRRYPRPVAALTARARSAPRPRRGPASARRDRHASAD